MKKPIEHTGVVIACEGKRVLVKFVQQTSCAACHARSMCMSAEAKEKEVWAYALEALQVGDEALVQVSERLAWKAILLAYGLPLVAMLVVLTILCLFVADWVAGLITLVALALYYAALSLFRDRLERTFDFTAIRKQSN